MSAELLPSRFDTRWLGQHARVLDAIESTSNSLFDWARDGAPHGALVVARTQGGGRGRQGRRWRSNVAGNLYVSWLLRLESPPPGLASLSLEVGLSLCETLQGFGLTGVQIKWPNDVWLGGQKVAGILLEARAAETTSVVVGVGLNLVTPADGWGELVGRATALDAHDAHCSPAEFLAAWMPRCEAGYERFLEEGAACVLERWPHFCALTGSTIEWDDATGGGEGEVLGLAGDGALRVRRAGEIVEIRAGEVHLVGRRS